MQHYFETKPKQVTTRVLSLIGLVLFGILYSIILSMFAKDGLDIQKFNQVWTSLDLNVFRQYMLDINGGGHTDTFVTIFKVNILSITCFSFGMFMLAVLTARRILETSRLHKTAFLIPYLAILVGMLDIVPSLGLLSASADMVNMADWKIHMIFWG